MGKRCAKHPFEDNPAIEGFLDWMDVSLSTQSDGFSAVFDHGI